MNYRKIILILKVQKSTELSAIKVSEMTAFYLVLLKYKKKRANFDIDHVMNEVYTAEIFAEFLANYYKR